MERRDIKKTSSVQFSSVQFSYSIYVSRSLIIKIMTAALTSSNCVKHLSFQPARVSVMSSVRHSCKTLSGIAVGSLVTMAIPYVQMSEVQLSTVCF